jgi:iron complex transport system substrate-binding protein
MRHLGKRLWAFVPRFSGIFAATALLVAGCSASPHVSVGVAQGPPKRIVSLDYCADQYVLKLAKRGDIVALSPDATRDFSYMRREAIGLPHVRPSSEDVLALRPDLIVRSYGGPPNAKAFFERAGIKVHQIGWSDDFGAVRENVRAAAEAMDRASVGEAVVAEFDKRLNAIEKAPGTSALYMTIGGVTTGSGSLIDHMMTHAGLTNFQTRPGWNPLPLERLVAHKPQMIVAAFFDNKSQHSDYWSSSRHPVARDMLTNLPAAQLDGSMTSCAGWFVVDGVEAMAKAGRAAHEGRL